MFHQPDAVQDVYGTVTIPAIAAEIGRPVLLQISTSAAADDASAKAAEAATKNELFMIPYPPIPAQLAF